MDALKELTEKIEALEARASEAVASVEKGDASLEEVKALINDDIKPSIDAYKAEKAELERAAEVKALQESLSTLQGAMKELRKPADGFTLGAEDEADEGKALTYEGSYFADVRDANKGIPAARERLLAYAEAKGVTVSAEGKAMTEGTGSQGGYLVQPEIERRIVEAIESDNVLRDLCSKVNVSSNSIQVDNLGLSTQAGWVAELASKPESTSMTLASVTASVFTAAGLATISNQLLADSNPAIDGLVTGDLVKRLVALEETAFINGSGTGQPLGILNTPSINTTTLSSTAIANTLEAVLDAISDVQENHGQPTAILMHPRTWTRILKGKDSSTGAYYVGQALDSVLPDFTSPRTRRGGPQFLLWGVPVVLSNRVPTNLGGGTNESRIIVGDFSEALILDRQGVTIDESPHVYFTTNQTVFRAEKRVGFTAARQTTAFNIVGGTGLAAG